MPDEKSSEFAGDPDGLKRLWTPHRLVYVEDHEQPDETNCPFCDAPKRPDAESLVVARGETVFAVLNLYPYNAGHILICPYRHFDNYLDSTNREREEIAVFTQSAMRALRNALGAEAFNIGINQGVAAGAGVASHLHQHVVPRWANDANFMPIIAKTKTMPRLLGEVRELVASAWK